MTVKNGWTMGALALVAALGVGRPAAADECGCKAAADSAAQALSSYKSAFAGRVVSVRDNGADRTVTLQVFRAWKGPRAKTLDVTTAAAACGAAFEQGADYVVFASGAKDALRTDSCAPNAALSQSARAVRQLDLETGYGSNPLRVPAAGGSTEIAQKH